MNTDNQTEDELTKTLFETFKSIHARVLPLNPLADNYLALSITLSGFGGCGDKLKMHVFYGDGCGFDVSSIGELKEKLAEYDPAEVKRKRIAELRSELDKLEAVEAKEAE